MRPCLLIRLISITVLVTFTGQELAHAMPAPQQQILPARPAPFSDVSKLEIPYEHVSIKSFHKGSNGKTLIHIQDPHSNYSGQKNIAQTIERFVKRYGLKTVFVEGGYGDVTLDDLRNIASKKDWGIVAKKFLMKSLITGPEYLNLTSDLKIKLFGIEDKALYESNVLAYSKIADNRDEVRGYLHTIQSSIDRLKNRLYPKELLHYENHKSRESDEGFSSNLDTLLKLIQNTPLSDLSDYPEVQKLKNLRQTEALVNFEKINNELRKLWGLIKARDRSKDAGDFMGFFQKASHFVVSGWCNVVSVNLNLA